MAGSAFDERVLALAPVGRDGSAIATLLRAHGVPCDVCGTIAELCRRIDDGAGALLLTDEALDQAGSDTFFDRLRDQPPWSAVPLIILTSGGEPRVAHLLDRAASAAGGVTLLERPLRAATLLRAADVALRSRRRQYEMRDLLGTTARLAAIVESSDDAIYSYDGDGVVLSWNGGAERLFGWSAEEMTGHRIGRITPPERGVEAAALIATVLEHQRVARIETECCRRDGTRIDVLQTASPVRALQGRPRAISVISRDITARKQTERALQESEATFRAMFSTSSVGKVQLDPVTGRFLQVNDAMCRLVGYTREELLGRAVLDITHPADQERDRDGMRRLLAGEIEDDDVEKRFIHAAGGVVWAQVTVNVIRDERGCPARYAAIVQDISRRRAAEDALQARHAELERTRARLEAAVEASQVVLFTQDRKLRYTWIHNPALGLAARDVVGKRDVDLLPCADDALQLEAIKWRVMETGVATRTEVHLRHADRTHTFDLVVQPDRTDAGVMAGVTCAALDVTERKRTEEALRTAGHSFRQLVEQSPFGVYAVDADFRLVLVSAGARKVFQNVRPLIGRDFDEVMRILWPEPFVGEVLRQFRRTLATGAPYHAVRTVEQRADSGDTEAYDWKIERTILPDGRAGVVCHFYDLSERQRHETDLRASELRYRTLLDATSAVTWTCPPCGRHVVPQPSWMAFTGQTAEEMLGDGWMQAIHPDDAADAGRRWRHAITTGTAYDSEHRLRRHDGEWRWMRATAAPVRSADGSVKEWFGALVDVSDRRTAEEQLRQADRQKDEFLAVLAHELRNPLAPIRTAAALLKTVRTADPLLLRSRDVIDRQVTHMARLLDDLLDVSRLSRGILTLQRSQVTLGEVLAAAIEVAAPLVEQRGQRLVVHGAGQGLALDGDRARLTQVFGNLLTNAAKYSPAGSTILVEVGADDGTAVVAVRDPGAGIAAEHLASIFELFTQVDATGHASAGGLGIGLALARRLVELHGGTVMAASDGAGRGSTFTVRLPVLQTPQRLLPAGPQTRGETLSWRVLVVDDNTDAADVIALLLEGAGCVVRTVYTGEAALLEIDTFKPEVALVDLGLPDLDGRDVCRRVRALPWGRQMVMIALTGWGRDDDRRSTSLAGFDHHLLKPVDPEVLVQLLGELAPPVQWRP